MIKNKQGVRDLKNICDEVNDLAQSSVKTGLYHLDEHISIYDSNCYDDMFGYQVLGRLDIDEDQLENDFYKNKLKAELLSKISTITGNPVWTARQKK